MGGRGEGKARGEQGESGRGGWGRHFDDTLHSNVTVTLPYSSSCGEAEIASTTINHWTVLVS